MEYEWKEREDANGGWVKGLHWIILKVFSSCNNSMILGSAGLCIQGMEVPRTAAGTGSHLKRKVFPWDQATQNGVCLHAGLKAFCCESKPETEKENRREEGDLFQIFPFFLSHSGFKTFIV